MAILTRYSDYLTHFGKTVTNKEFFTSSASNQLCLRHDVDHDIDVALEMACLEYHRNFKSTYFVLPGTNYWENDALFLKKCQQIQDFGHEVGLHINYIADWYKGIINDPEEALKRDLARLRGASLNITGIATHGDKACYKANFINYWMFEELKSTDPQKTETGLTAEGTPSAERHISYNYPDDQITRPDGEKIRFWTLKMVNHNLNYHATHIACDKYFTDSGGGWNITEDPINSPSGVGRQQINIHPIHWQGEKSIYFFLSAARSSSKWLSGILNSATSIDACHEHFLNFSYKNQVYCEDHKTGLDYIYLANDSNLITTCLHDARDWALQSSKKGYGEVNVYLERYVEELKELFPNATFIYLSRDPENIVTSIMNRNWYDTEKDTRHPPVAGISNWEELDPFDRCCHYVKDVADRLQTHCQFEISSEEITGSENSLSTVLREIGIAYYPRLAENIFQTQINANTVNTFPTNDEWPQHYKETFDKIMNGGKISTFRASSQQKKYPFRDHLKRLFSCYTSQIFSISSAFRREELKKKIKQKKKILYRTLYKNKKPPAIFLTENVLITQKTICIKQLGSVHEWVKFQDIHNCKQGENVYILDLDAEFNAGKDGLAQVFLFGYDKNETQVEKRLLLKLKPGAIKASNKFRIGFATSQIGLLFQVPNNRGSSNLIITKLNLTLDR